MTPDELQQLIDAALEGVISEADAIRLEAELSVAPESRRLYYDRVLLTVLLEAEATQTKAIVEPAASTQRFDSLDRSDRRWKRAFGAMVFVCGILLTFMASRWNRTSTDSRDIQSADVSSRSESIIREQLSSGYAVVSGQSDAVWRGRVSLATGTLVPPGELHLERGIVQLDLFSGVTLVIEGETRLSILSPMEVSVQHGKIRARVPEPAQGFRVVTTAGEVIDLGTEFAIDVSEDRSEVHVLEGAVDWIPTGSPAQRLQEGDATLSTSKGVTRLAADTDRFIGSVGLQHRLQAQRANRIAEWQTANRGIRELDHLVAHYVTTPEHVAHRRLPNLAIKPSVPASEGAVVAADAAPNRWGQPQSALDFSPAGSRVRLHIPGEYQHLTLVAWVRINSLDRWYNSLFLTDGHDQGEPHWQIMDDGRLFFSVKKHDEWDAAAGQRDKHVFYSPPFWNNSLSGRWLMLATVYDGTRRQVTHFLNGKVLSTEPIPEEYLVTAIRIGDASLCNWGLPERDQPGFAIRNLNGTLDEFLLFQQPLSPDEIKQLYRLGQP